MTETTNLRIAPADPDEPDGRELIAELGAELERVTGWFGSSSYTARDARVPGGVFVIARDATTGRALGCGAIRPLGDAPTTRAELKRMYARRGTRGVGHAILVHLEGAARSLGYATLCLETGVTNARALQFYERHGYRPIDSFGPYVGHPESACLGKALGTSDDDPAPEEKGHRGSDLNSSRE